MESHPFMQGESGRPSVPSPPAFVRPFFPQGRLSASANKGLGSSRPTVVLVSNMDDTSYIYGTQQEELNKTKEVKMRIPVSQLIRLHSLKLLKGQNISETVAKALTVYFDQVDADKAEARSAAEHDSAKDVAVDATF